MYYIRNRQEDGKVLRKTAGAALRQWSEHYGYGIGEGGDVKRLTSADPQIGQKRNSDRNLFNGMHSRILKSA